MREPCSLFFFNTIHCEVILAGSTSTVLAYGMAKYANNALVHYYYSSLLVSNLTTNRTYYMYGLSLFIPVIHGNISCPSTNPGIEITSLWICYSSSIVDYISFNHFRW